MWGKNWPATSTKKWRHWKNLSERKELNLTINNIVTKFNVKCTLDLREIALKGHNTQLKNNELLIMKLRQSKITTLIQSSGKIICKKATCLDNAKKAARCIARILQNNFHKLHFLIIKFLGYILLLRCNQL